MAADPPPPTTCEKHGILLHVYSGMSNHLHDEITDVRGVLPDFLRDLHREVALAAKELYGIHDNFWSAETPSAVELIGREAQLEKALYIVLNPVSAGLVARASEWPGAISLPGMRSKTVKRPKYWFSESRPETVELVLTPPPAWDGTHDEWDAWLASEVARREREIAEVRKGKPPLGRRRVRNLCVGALIEAVRDRVKTVDLKQVNRVLVQPHWREHRDHAA